MQNKGVITRRMRRRTDNDQMEKDTCTNETHKPFHQTTQNNEES